MWGSDLSFYLDGIGEWNPRPSRLVHEIAMRFSGQYAFNDRLIPNEQAVAGGLYTVRGYPESVVAGDTAIYGSVEYRFHLPRALPNDENPPTAFGRPFRVGARWAGRTPGLGPDLQGVHGRGAGDQQPSSGVREQRNVAEHGRRAPSW